MTVKKNIIAYSRQEITNEDIFEVEKVLRSDFITQGPQIPKFEKAVSEYCNTSYAYAVNSATSALHLACLALNLGKGDILWTVPNTFVASANCALHCGAEVDFVDIDPKTYNICIDALSDKLSRAEKFGKLPKIIIPVHYAGQPCNMPVIYKLSKRYGFKIIEDASHASGASYNQIKVGSCVHSDITVFSFHAIKIITCAEGGMVLTNNREVADKISILRSHGITSDKAKMKERPEDEIWNYQQIDLGFNYRMTDIQASLGLSQLKRIDKSIKLRHEIAHYYNTQLKNFLLVLPWQSPNVYSSYHLYPVRIDKKLTKISQKEIYNILENSGIAINLHYIPVHRHPFYENFGFKKGDFPESERFHCEVLSLPMFPNLSRQQQDFVINTLTAAIKNR